MVWMVLHLISFSYQQEAICRQVWRCTPVIPALRRLRQYSKFQNIYMFFVTLELYTHTQFTILPSSFLISETRKILHTHPTHQGPQMSPQRGFPCHTLLELSPDSGLQRQSITAFQISLTPSNSHLRQ
jgi:hypothetical protein